MKAEGGGKGRRGGGQEEEVKGIKKNKNKNKNKKHTWNHLVITLF